MDFLAKLGALEAKSLAVFGDSISVGLNASAPQRSWAALLGQAAGIAEVRNHAFAGTILQSAPMANGMPRQDNGVSRWQELIGPQRADALAILYGYNDARYVAAPQSLNVANFQREYAGLIEGLLAAGFRDRLVIGSPPYIPDAGLAIGSPGFAGQDRASFERYVQVVRSLAAQYELFYAPVYEAMAAHEDGLLASDDIVHPNDEGHAVISRAFQTARRV